VELAIRATRAAANHRRMIQSTLNEQHHKDAPVAARSLAAHPRHERFDAVDVRNDRCRS